MHENSKSILVGTAVLLSGLATFLSLSVGASATSAPPQPGEREWLQCRACHTLGKNETNKLGPNLYGIVGAKAGTRPGYRYSTALAESGLVWDHPTLDRFIERPNAVLKGHKMAYVGMSDADKRDKLISYIAIKTRQTGK